MYVVKVEQTVISTNKA